MKQESTSKERLTHPERRVRRQEMAKAVKSGQPFSAVAFKFGVTESHVRLQEGKTDSEIRQTAGTVPSIVTLAIRQIRAQERKKREATRKWKMQQKREAKKWAWQQNYKIAPHLLLLKKPVDCKECGASVTQVMRKYRDYICGECGMSRLKKMGMISATLLLTLCAGCQVPREMRVDAHVAGQTLKVQVLK